MIPSVLLNDPSGCWVKTEERAQNYKQEGPTVGASRRTPWWLGPGRGLWMWGRMGGTKRCGGED